jgi:hypothetical protein
MASNNPERAKAQMSLFSKKKRGRPAHLALFLDKQRDLFPVELSVACHAPHYLPGASAQRPQQCEDAGPQAPLGKSIRNLPPKSSSGGKKGA